LQTLRSDLKEAFQNVNSRMDQNESHIGEIVGVIKSAQAKRPDLIPRTMPVDFHTIRGPVKESSDTSMASKTKKGRSDTAVTPRSHLSGLMRGLESLKVQKVSRKAFGETLLRKRRQNLPSPPLPPNFEKEPEENPEEGRGTTMCSCPENQGKNVEASSCRKCGKRPARSPEVINLDDLPPVPSISEEAWLSPTPSPPLSEPEDEANQSKDSSRKSQKRNHETFMEGGGGGGQRPPKRLAMGGSPSSSPSSSSSSDLDPSGDDWSLNSRRHRFQAKRQLQKMAYEDALRAVKYKKRDAPKIEVVRMKRPDPIRPDKYNGERSKWTTWWSAMVDYLEETKVAFPTDIERVRVVGSFLSGSARNWYDCRKRRLEVERGRGIDSYPLFVEELKKRFSDPQWKVSARNKLRDLRYDVKKGIDAYLTDLNDANLEVGKSGVDLICQMREQVPFEIWSLIPDEAMIEDADEYSYQLRNRGISWEYSRENYKAIHGSYPSSGKIPDAHTDQSGKKGKKDKKKQQKKGDNQTEQSAGKDKPSQPNSESKSKKGGTSSKKKRVPYRDPKEWFAGVSRDEQTKREERGNCPRCDRPGKEGKPPHSKWECPNPVKTGEYEPKASAASKRKREEENGESERKRLAVEAKVAATSGPRIVELRDSDSESGFSFAGI
jgi:hypothetical protein